MMVPVDPYIGQVTVAVGLQSPLDGDRLPLEGMHLGERAYSVGTLDMVPPSRNGLAKYRDGWHGVESGTNRDWRWTTGRATIVFPNPRSAATLHLEVGGQPELLADRTTAHAGDRRDGDRDVGSRVRGTDLPPHRRAGREPR